MSKVSELIGKLHGETGIFSRLRQEHAALGAMLQKMSDTGEDEQGARSRCAIFPLLRGELLAHGYAEEQEFYSVLRRHNVLKPIIDSSEEDHREMELLLQQLSPTDLDGRTWRPGFERLRDTVERHMDQEEQDVFPKALAVLTRNDAREIEERYQKMKDRAMRRLELAGGMSPQPLSSAL